MRFQMPEQAVHLRGLAAQLRHSALETNLPNYRLKLEVAAADLEMEAARIEKRARFRAKHRVAH